MNLIDCIAMLLAAKANPALIDNEGASALHYAAQHNHIDAIKLLATSAALTNVEDQNGANPLMWAAAGNHEAAIQTLLDCGAEVNHVDKSGRSALHTAVYGGSVECTTLLLDAKADEAIADASGQTALFSACNEGRVDLAAILLKYGSDPRVQDVEARTPAHWAAIVGHGDVVELLVHQFQQYFWTIPLCISPSFTTLTCHATCILNVVPMLMMLAIAHAHGACNSIMPDIMPDSRLQVTESPEIMSDPDERGETIMHYSAFFGHPEIVAYLITVEADINAQDYDGITALHWGALKGNTAIVRQLCEAGVYTNYMEANGAKSTAYDYAVNGGFDECAAVIAEYGGMFWG